MASSLGFTPYHHHVPTYINTTGSLVATSAPSLWSTILLTACAGGLGWGIRGQYGHETGAMIAGVLVGLTIALLFRETMTSQQAARMVALAAIGVSFGGSMTYGQTVGLTHDAELFGNWAALRWGLLGLFIKGGIWIGLAGAFLGIGLSRMTYRPFEMAILLLGMAAVLLLGVQLLNQPFAPELRQLPWIYFSDHWHWEPDKADLKPRFERWGGLLLALAGLLVYVRAIRQDTLPLKLALVGFVAGGVGFASGQSLQAFHAWSPEFFQRGVLARFDPLMNWWNMMEITFGVFLGGGLGVGVWLTRRSIGQLQDAETVSFPVVVDWVLAAVYVVIIVTWNFLSVDRFDAIADLAIPIGIIPVIGIFGGRLFPYLMALPLVCVPIAGKTLRHLVNETHLVDTSRGWLMFVVTPLLLMSIVAVHSWNDGRRDSASSARFAAVSLFVATWVYFWLNFAFFHFPWPWLPPTSRTPSAWIMLCFAGALTAATVFRFQRKPS